MSTEINDPERRIVPRWRPWRESVHLGAADPSTQVYSAQKPSPINLMRAKYDWETNRAASFAGDFVGAAFAIGESQLAREAAEFVLTAKSGSSKAARELARQILSDEGAGGPRLTDPVVESEEDRRRKIKTLRASLHEAQRNPLSYMDLAREYVALGQPSAARRPIEIALALAPNSRFVLRSASRFFLHLNDRERAHDVLRTAELVRSDPWLLAAEIAVASAAGRTSSLIKVGRELVESDRFSPTHISELATALGTLECEAGNRRLVRRFLRRALIEPNENVVAQAGWISRNIGDLQIDERALRTPRSYEARAWVYLLEGLWEDSLVAAEFWLRDEPFASRAAIFASWVATLPNSAYERAVKCARIGLVTHPNNFLLLNNLTVALAYLGRTEEAVRTYDEINPDMLSGSFKTTYLATKGLVQFRLGSPDEGRGLYQMALADAKERRDSRSLALALLHLSQEEARYDLANSRRLLSEAVEETMKLPESYLRRVASLFGEHLLKSWSESNERKV